MQRIAVQGIFECAGRFRQVPISIGNTSHDPPPWQEVPHLALEMCEYANTVASDAFHASAYLMWRLNWIHPFSDGNGRTSRAVSYLALCCGIGIELPGTVTVPDLIVKNRQPYYAALDSADAAWKRGKLDIGEMEDLIKYLLTQQLQSGIDP